MKSNEYFKSAKAPFVGPKAGDFKVGDYIYYYSYNRTTEPGRVVKVGNKMIKINSNGSGLQKAGIRWVNPHNLELQ